MRFKRIIPLSPLCSMSMRPLDKGVTCTWRRHYNVDRPHSDLDYLTPAAFKTEDREQKKYSAEAHVASRK